MDGLYQSLGQRIVEAARMAVAMHLIEMQEQQQQHASTPAMEGQRSTAGDPAASAAARLNRAVRGRRDWRSRS